MQVEQRQHLGDLRRLPGPGRQDRRGEPLALTGLDVGALVVDPGARTGTTPAPHRHGTGCGGPLTRLVVAVADHQPSTILVELAGVVLDLGRDLGLQRRCQPLPGTVADDLIEQRPTHRGRSVCVGLGLFFDDLEHGRTFGEPARQRRS